MTAPAAPALAPAVNLDTAAETVRALLAFHGLPVTVPAWPLELDALCLVAPFGTTGEWLAVTAAPAVGITTAQVRAALDAEGIGWKPGIFTFIHATQTGLAR